MGRKPFPVKGDPIVPQGPAQTPDIGRQLLTGRGPRPIQIAEPSESLQLQREGLKGNGFDGVHHPLRVVVLPDKGQGEMEVFPCSLLPPHTLPAEGGLGLCQRVLHGVAQVKETPHNDAPQIGGYRQLENR